MRHGTAFVPVKRALIACVVWLVATVVLAPPLFFGVILLAGPHSDLLPDALSPAVLIAGWLVLLGAPLWAARAAWRRWSH